MGKLFKLHTVKSDGSATGAETTVDFLVIDPSTSKPFVENGEPSVVITLRPITSQRHREAVANHTQRVLNKKTRAMEDQTEWDDVQDELVSYAIVSWKGILGADDQPLQCVLDAKLALPGELKNELIGRAMQGEAVDSAASFRSAS